MCTYVLRIARVRRRGVDIEPTRQHNFIFYECEPDSSSRVWFVSQVSPYDGIACEANACPLFCVWVVGVSRCSLTCAPVCRSGSLRGLLRTGIEFDFALIFFAHRTHVPDLPIKKSLPGCCFNPLLCQATELRILSQSPVRFSRYHNNKPALNMATRIYVGHLSP